MTLSELRTEVYELLGEPTDLDPNVSTTRLNSIINLGVKRIAGWKEPGLGQVRFRNLFKSMYFKSHVKTETLDTGSTTTTLVLDASGPGTDDVYNGWVVKVSGEYVLVVDYVASTKTIYLASEVSTAPASALDITFYQSYFQFLTSTSALVDLNIAKPVGFVDVLKLFDLYQNAELTKPGRTISFMSDVTQVGDPTEYYRYGNGIVLNAAVETERYFKMEYYGLPATLVNDTDEPDFPDGFHYGVVLWALWWGYKRTQENSAAYSAKRDLVDFMRTTKTEYDVYMDRSDGYGHLKVKG